MLFDMQSEGGGHRNGNGGDGWLRIIEFYPDNKTVKVKTYSLFSAFLPLLRKMLIRRIPEMSLFLSFRNDDIHDQIFLKS
ncbi:hypothetical protein [Chryseobacterium wanjuense]